LADREQRHPVTAAVEARLQVTAAEVEAPRQATAVAVVAARVPEVAGTQVVEAAIIARIACF
jgi:hypothetical protein